MSLVPPSAPAASGPSAPPARTAVPGAAADGVRADRPDRPGRALPLAAGLAAAASGLGLGAALAYALMATGVGRLWGLEAPAAAALAAAGGGLLAALPLAWLLAGPVRRRAAESEPAAALAAGSGLPRAAFMELAEREWARARRYGSGAALVLVELDGPVRLVQAQGAAAADRLVDELLRLTALSLRPADLITRLGPSRLAVFLAQADATGALDVAERIRERVERLPPAAGRPAAVGATASLGVSTLRLAHSQLQALIDDAEMALAAARQAGGNCVRSAPAEAGRLRGAAWRGHERRARPKQGGAP